jgi:hypothetical protein
MSTLSPKSPTFALASPQGETSNDHVVVTYLDSNHVWKDYVVEPKDVVRRQIGLTEQEISCVVPNFWSHIPSSAHIKHVRCTVNGETFQLPWPPSAEDPLASPTLTLHVQLHDGLEKALTYAKWQEAPMQHS